MQLLGLPAQHTDEQQGVQPLQQSRAMLYIVVASLLGMQCSSSRGAEAGAHQHASETPNGLLITLSM